MRKFFVLLSFLIASSGWAGSLTERTGWVIHPTGMTFKELVDATKSSVKKNGFGVVTQAGPTKAAASRGITIPGNRVIGVFNNDFAVRVLKLSTAAMIEAPIRLYVTENEDGTATLSYKTPTLVFAPYADEGGAELAKIATDLDARFAKIVAEAIKN